MYRIVKFNQKGRLKPYFNMNTDLRKKQKVNSKKTFLS